MPKLELPQSVIRSRRLMASTQTAISPSRLLDDVRMSCFFLSKHVLPTRIVMLDYPQVNFFASFDLGGSSMVKRGRLSSNRIPMLLMSTFTASPGACGSGSFLFCLISGLSGSSIKQRVRLLTSRLFPFGCFLYL